MVCPNAPKAGHLIAQLRLYKILFRFIDVAQNYPLLQYLILGYYQKVP